MVGITMVLAIAICIFGAAGLFAALSRPFSDLIPMVAPAAEVQVAETPIPAPEQQAAQAPETEPNAAEPAAEPTVAPTEAPSQPEFQPTHQINALTSVNFRTGPSVNDPVIIALSPATPLQYLEEEETAPDGDTWMRFRTDAGDEGWILEDLVGPYEPS